MGKLVTVSIKVPEEVKELMDSLNINWSEFLREAIIAKIRQEQASRASSILDEIRSRAKSVSTEEMVRWVREDRSR
ncbi:MAG: hypothetical protein NZ517_04585 [Candidatus Nitrosocaldus sp.]|nr:hypothetical protein [Candidatus Nitrosocaldus sp.]